MATMSVQHDGRGRGASAAPITALGPVGRMEIVLAAGELILVGADVDDALAQGRLVHKGVGVRWHS